MGRYHGLLGIALILGIAFIASNNKRKINLRLVISGIGLQVIIGILVLKVPFITNFFSWIGRQIGPYRRVCKSGCSLCIFRRSGRESWCAIRNDGIPGSGGFVFAFSVTATIIIVCALVAIFYYLGVMQRIVALIATAMNFIMRVSGAEALSNVASAFVGQVEAQVMIRPYLSGMTMSELLASMSGSLACIAGGILVVYVNMGAPAEYLLTASLMAAPGALVISKIVWPETEESQTMGRVKLEVKSEYRNIIDAISQGAADGMKIAINVIAMLIGFLAIIALVNFLLGKIGGWIHLGIPLTLDLIFSKIFYPVAWSMGVPAADIGSVATLMGKKLTINEFVAFFDLTHGIKQTLSPKGLLIVSFAICGFANFSSVGMQIGGIGALAPERPWRSCQAWYESSIMWHPCLLFISNHCRYFNRVG
jgi:CNT family concentrative nucleoside transporter